MSEHDSGGKRGGGATGKGGSFWDHARTIGQGVLEGVLGTPSTKRPATRTDPMATERTAAAKQIHRSLSAWRDRQSESDGGADTGRAAPTVARKRIHRTPDAKPPIEELKPLLHAEALAAVSGLAEDALKKILEHMKGPRKQDVNDLLRIFTIKKNKNKPVPEGDVMSYLTARLAGSAQTQERKYPFGFENEENYKKFSERVKAAAGHWGLPTGDIRVQGSSVSRPEPKDIDVAVMVDEGTFKTLVERFKGNTDKDRIKKMIDTDFKKGKITSFCMDRMEVPKDSGLGQPIKPETIQIQLVHAIDDGNADAKGTAAAVQISVVKIGGDFDLGPFIPVT